MDLNVPGYTKAFHASWQRDALPDDFERWSTRLPILANGKIYGRVELIGRSSRGEVFQTLAVLSELMESIQPEIEKLSSESSAQSSPSERTVVMSQVAATTPLIRT